MTPSLVIRPILLPRHSASQRLPSGLAVMPRGQLLAVGIGNSVMTPAVVKVRGLHTPSGRDPALRWADLLGHVERALHRHL
jgi:hypothetical protein